MALHLMHAIAEAAALAGGNLCAAGHDWKSEGGRSCYYEAHDSAGDCSMSVYACARCGAYDYGEPGGPGYDDCLSCHNRRRGGA